MPSQATSSYYRVSLENLFDTHKAGEVKSGNVIIKADVQGSVEALALPTKIEVEGVRRRLKSSTQRLFLSSRSVTLAEASNAVIIGSMSPSWLGLKV